MGTRGNTYFLSIRRRGGEDGKEKRRFFRLGPGNLIHWLSDAYGTLRTGESWHRDKLRHVEAFRFDSMLEEGPFLDVRDGKAIIRVTSADHLRIVHALLDEDATEHLIRYQHDDDEDESVEVYIFDDDFLASSDAYDILPNPRRGGKRHDPDDKYWQMIEWLRKRAESARSPKRSRG